MSKQKDLFENEIKSEYTQFTDKFKPKLTTDDCYTPPNVFEWVLSYVKKQCNISDDTRIIRPFKPNGDYLAEDYSGNCVVIDNPPFSILAQICRHYNEIGVRYFLFAPHLTLFSSNVDATRIVASCDIEYENGAKVKTSFISNMFGDYGVIADPNYRREIHKIQQRDKVALPKYKYHDCIVSVSRLGAIVERGGKFKLLKSEVRKVSQLESQKDAKKSLFGSGYFIPELKAEELKAEESKIKEKTIEWKLSPKEKAIIAELGGQKPKFIEQKLF